MFKSITVLTVAVIVSSSPCFGETRTKLASEAGATPRSVATKGGLPGASDEAVARLRGMITQMKATHNPKLVARANRMELYTAILAARTRVEYFEAVRKLSVTIERFQAADGRVIKRYIVAGKTRLEIAARAHAAPLGASEELYDRPGPSLALPSSECYMEEEEPCLTPEEEDAWASEVAYAGYDTEVIEADHNSSQGQWDDYCANNSWDSVNCGFASGPSAAPACASEAWESLQGVTASAIGYFTAKGKIDDARLAGKALSAATVTASRLVMWTSVLGASYFTGYFGACVVYHYILTPYDATHDLVGAVSMRSERKKLTPRQVLLFRLG